MKRLTLAAVLACAAFACKKKEANQTPQPATGSGSASGSGSAAAPAKPSGPKLDGTKVTPVRCEIANLGTEFKRSLQADDKGNLYVFDDGRQPHVIKAGAGPCGLAYAETMSMTNNLYAFAKGGGIVAPPEDRGECETRGFSTFAWTGTVAGDVAYVIKDNGHAVEVEVLGLPCTKRMFSMTMPEQGRVADVAANADVVLLVNFIASGNDGNAIWRYTPDGKPVDKIGLKPDGGSQLGWVDRVTTCADGACALESGKLVVFDAAGKLVGKHDIRGDWKDVVDVVETNGALYALVTDKDKNADLLRLDGVFAK